MRVFDDHDSILITDLIFDSNLSTREIARELEATEVQVKQRVRELGLSWVRRRDGHLSRGQAALTAQMRKLLPGERIVTEYPLGERLRLDVFCESYDLGVEYHGRQHFMYVEHFHNDKEGFRDSQRRDERKLEICRDLGIALVAFRYNDSLTEGDVYQRLLEAIQMTPVLDKPTPQTVRGEPHYEAYKQRQREYNRAAYRRMRAGGR